MAQEMDISTLSLDQLNQLKTQHEQDFNRPEHKDLTRLQSFFCTGTATRLMKPVWRLSHVNLDLNKFR